MLHSLRLHLKRARQQAQFERALRDAEPRMRAELLAAARYQR